MKNKLLLACAALLLLIFLGLGTYAWYLFFLRASGDFAIHNNNNLKKGDISLVDDGKNVYDADADSIEDELVDEVEPYKFKIVNSGDKEDKYTLFIEDLPLNSINDGCTSSTLLTRDLLKYQLKLEGRVIKEDYLSNIKDNILDERMVEGNDSNEYELRIYIHDEALNWTGKHYHYKVVLNKK